MELLKNTVVNSTNSYVVAVLVDIQGAFDSLLRPVVLNNLNRVHVSKTFFETIGSYLSSRKATLTNDGETTSRTTTKGCPQGSVLGPLLWNISFDSLLTREFLPGVTPIAFADDVAFMVTGDTRTH